MEKIWKKVSFFFFFLYLLFLQFEFVPFHTFYSSFTQIIWFLDLLFKFHVHNLSFIRFIQFANLLFDFFKFNFHTLYLIWFSYLFSLIFFQLDLCHTQKNSFLCEKTLVTMTRSGSIFMNFWSETHLGIPSVPDPQLFENAVCLIYIL